MRDNETVDITPSPRILRVLGEIPFQPWQCFAELMDNSIDALLKQRDADEQKAVYVYWSRETTSSRERTVEVSDNAPGMTLEQMRNAVRAGYSNNNPIGNLGLFGMGFNIATAKLGNRTEIWSTTVDDSDWHGIRIDFNELSKGDNFEAPLLRRPKGPTDSSGTHIVISELKSGTWESISQHEREIRQTLENIYAPLLLEHNIDLYVNRKILHPKRPCVWGSERFVNYKGHKVPAKFEIDEQLGEALFDLDRNAYLSPDEQEEYEGIQTENLPVNLCYRERHLHGWIGIQRYFDTNDYGIDFIRNGRKILIQDKSLFSFTNPLTGESELQYPVELGTTVGGRIVGQLHVDYLLPTYQKNDFDRYDSTWYETVSVICGDGPFLPKKRKALGLDEVPDKPLGLLVNAYRRTEPGTKNLALPKAIAKEYLREFNKGNAEYISDTKWWIAAQECDQARQQGNNPPANTGREPSDDVDSFLPDNAGKQPPTTLAGDLDPNSRKQPPSTSKPEDLKARSHKVESLSKRYRPGLDGTGNQLDVRVYELNKGEIIKDGSPAPFMFYSRGYECDFFYDPRHRVIQQYPITPVEYLFLYLSERFKMRDQLDDIGLVYETLVERYLSDERVDAVYLRERAEAFFSEIREPLKNLLEPVSDQVVASIHESAGEIEDAMAQAVQSGVDFARIKIDSETAYEIMDYVPNRTLLRLIESYPERVFDKKLFNDSYMDITLSDKSMEQRLRDTVKERVVAYIKDLLYLISATSTSVSKNDLERISLSLSSLQSKLTDYELFD